MLLAIDTSNRASAAVVAGSENPETLSMVTLGDHFGHAENIGEAISQALADAGVTPDQLTAVAMGRGPANYTGLRVGMAAAQAFAQARKLPLYGVATLDAVAALGPVDQPFAVTADAKRREQFAGFYSGRDRFGLAVRVDELRVLGGEALLAELSERGIELVLSDPCDAALIGHFALRARAAAIELGDTSALYLRSPDVTPSAGKRVTDGLPA
jgi:tRNA threonylcarbamoyladenosine biosynthesis protein TsaB